MEGRAPPTKDGVFGVGEKLSTETLAAVLSALSQSHNHNLSLYDFSLLLPPSAGSQGEWLPMRDSVLALLEGTW